MNECQARKLVYARSEGHCEFCSVARATDYGHRKNRSQGGDWSPSNALHLCHECHMWAHANPVLANGLGVYLKSWQDPETEPVRLGGRWVLLDDDGSIRAAVTS